MDGLYPHQQPPDSIEAVQLALCSVLSLDNFFAKEHVRISQGRGIEKYYTLFIFQPNNLRASTSILVILGQQAIILVSKGVLPDGWRVCR